MNVRNALIRIFDLFGVEHGKTNDIQHVVSLDEYNERVRPTLKWLWKLSGEMDPNVHNNVDEARTLDSDEKDTFESEFRRMKIFCDIPFCAVIECKNKRHELTAYCEKHQKFATGDKQFVELSYQFFVDSYEEETECIHFPDAYAWVEWCKANEIDCEQMQSDIRRKFPHVIKD